MVKTILISAILICFAGAFMSLSGQTAVQAVYLKNGSIIYGKVLENIPGERVKIEIVGRNQLVFPYTEVDRVELALPQKDTPAAFTSSLVLGTTANFYGGTTRSGGFSLITSYRFPSRVSTGLGTGIDFFDYQLLPVYGDVSVSMLSGSFSPMIYGRFGYSFPLSEPAIEYGNETKYKGGILAGTGVGLRKDFRNHCSFIFTVGYRYQRLKAVSEYLYYFNDSSQRIERIDKLNRLQVSIGFIF